MRDHKYRGKDLETGEWRVGSLVTYTFEGAQHVFIYVDNCRDEPMEKVEVDPETVGEYTGLVDRNGTEIYEGDIVREMYSCAAYHEPIVNIAPIIWKDGAYSFNDDDISLLFDNPERYEVISNIHDQPLEGA